MCEQRYFFPVVHPSVAFIFFGNHDGFAVTIRYAMPGGGACDRGSFGSLNCCARNGDGTPYHLRTNNERNGDRVPLATSIPD